MNRLLLLTVLAVFIAESPANAGFADAVQAYDGGDYATALAESLEAARRGDADAQYMAGFLYMGGLGAPRDLKRAYQWFMLAARHGDEFAARELEGLASRMSAALIAEAEAWAIGWRPSP